MRSAAGQPFTVIREPGFPLGVTPEATFDNQTAPFEPGAMLLLFSDALIEAPPPPDAIFSADSLCAFIDTAPLPGGPHALCDAILAHLFANIDEKLPDDLTLIAAHYVEGAQP